MRIRFPLSLALPGVILLCNPTEAVVPGPVGGIESIPFAFTEFRSPALPAVSFTARGNGYSLSISATGASFLFAGPNRPTPSGNTTPHPGASSPVQPVSLTLDFLGSNPDAVVRGENRLPWNSSYFMGDDSSEWITGASNYREVRVEEAYEGVDIVYSGGNGGIKYDLVVKPGADPSGILLRYSGEDDTNAVGLSPDGELVISTALGSLVEQKPVCYQKLDGRTVEVPSKYRLTGAAGEFGFEIGAYDPRHELIIDPELVYSTFIGGQGADVVNAAAVDGQGNVYLTGSIVLSGFPKPAGLAAASEAGSNAFVIKMNPEGTLPLYTTFIGSNSGSSGTAITVDTAGCAYVAGYTNPENFPVKQGSYSSGITGGIDAFVIKLKAEGSQMDYAARIGGNADDAASGIALDSYGYAYITGYTSSANYPCVGAYDASFNGVQDAFITKLSTTGSTLAYSTYLGGTKLDAGIGIALSDNGEIYISGNTESNTYPTVAGSYDISFNGGQDIFLTRLNSSGATLQYSTFLGGISGDTVTDFEVDWTGDITLAGYTASSNFPIVAGSYDTIRNGGQDGFLTRLSTSTNKLVFSTFLGGSGNDAANGLTMNATGSIYVVGTTASPNFPVTSDAYDASHNGSYDVFLLKLNPFGSSLIYSTFLGSDSDDLGAAVALSDSAGVIVAGSTASSGFPVESGAYDTGFDGGYDGFLLKFRFEPDPITGFVVISVRDIPNDQGKQVRVTWSAHQNDVSSALTPVTGYSVWRKVDASLPAVWKTGVIPPGEWDFITDVPAVQTALYSAVAPTLADSTARGIRWSEFYVCAHTATPKNHFETPALRGYSVDNISPSAVRRLAVMYKVTGNTVSWEESDAPDFSRYTVYRSDTPDFMPDSDTCIGETTEPVFIDQCALSGTVYYKVAACDFSGNRGISNDYRFVMLLPPYDVTITDIPGDQGHRLRITWKKPVEPLGVVHKFRIYRSRSPEPTEPLPLSQFRTIESLIEAEAHSTVLIDSVSASQSEYTDPFVPLDGVPYYYWVQAVGYPAVSKLSPVDARTGIVEAPARFQVSPPYPNPFNPATIIRYELPEESMVRIVIYDALGRTAAVLWDGRKSAGRHEAVWDGRDRNGKLLGSGVYLYTVAAGNRTVRGKLTFLR